MTNRSTDHQDGNSKGWSSSFAEIWEKISKTRGLGDLSTLSGYDSGMLISVAAFFISKSSAGTLDCHGAYGWPIRGWQKSKKSEPSCLSASVCIHLQQRVFTFITEPTGPRGVQATELEDPSSPNSKSQPSPRIKESSGKRILPKKPRIYVMWLPGKYQIRKWTLRRRHKRNAWGSSLLG